MTRSIHKAPKAQGTWRGIRHLARRATAAFDEGGFPLLTHRLRRWSQHQRDRLFPSKAYRRFVEANDPTPDELNRQAEWAKSLSKKTLISIVCPLYQTPLSILKETVQSVVRQSYPFWELCLTVCDQESDELKDYVRDLSQADARIKLVGLEQNGGISQNTNAAIRAAGGEWIAFLDHDDLLSPDAFYHIASHLDRHPDCDLVYSDEDLISADGKTRRSPVLKPGWSPEMLLHFNYVCHFVAIRAELLTALGGMRSEYDGAQDWDLLLRASETTERIHHLPRILYHWRELATSTAKAVRAKPYVLKAQRRTLEDSLRRRGIAADVQTARFGHHRPVWKITGEPLVSVIIPNRDQPALIKRLVKGILEQTDYRHTEIVIVDNASQDPRLRNLYQVWKANARIKVVAYNEPFNYSAACNRGAKEANGEFLLFLNNDIEITKADWLDELLRWGELSDVGIVGPHLVYPDGRTQHAGIVLGLYDLAGHMFHGCRPETYGPFGMAEWVRNVSAVTGACQLVKAKLFHELEGYDEGYRLLYSDIAFCLRAARQGFRVVYDPHVRLIHHECSTRNPQKPPGEDAVRFAELLKEHGIAKDPYYHPALTATSKSPQFKPAGAINVQENLQRLIPLHIGEESINLAEQRAA